MRPQNWTLLLGGALLLLIAAIALPLLMRDAPSARLDRDGPVQLAPHDSQARIPAEFPLTDWLPLSHVTDGSIDYRVEVQSALDALAGETLLLPDFAIQVGRAPGQNYGLIVRHGMCIRGTSASKLVTSEKALQLLRAENVQDLKLEGFAVQGPGGDGTALGHGLIQITGGKYVHVSGLRIRDADADGIAIAMVNTVLVEDLYVEGVSKSGIYLSACNNAVVRANCVRDFGGHFLKSGQRVGVGIQLSSCGDTTCTLNTIRNGLGVGILCNATQGGVNPLRNALTGNHIFGVSNPQNINVSGGIRLANGNVNKETQTEIQGNLVAKCGVNGIYVENHGKSTVQRNLVQDSVDAGILVSSISGVEVAHNVIANSGLGHGAIEMINAAEDVKLEGNVTP